MTPENTRPLRRPKTLLKHKVLLNGQLSWNNHNKSAPDLHFTLDEGCRNIKGMGLFEIVLEVLRIYVENKVPNEDKIVSVANCYVLERQNW